MGQPDDPALFPDPVDHVLGRHVRRIYIFVDVQGDEVVALSPEGVVRVQLGSLDQDEVVGHGDRVYPGDSVVVG